MRTLLRRVHHWIILAERGLLRLFLVMIGLALILVSLVFDLSLVMLPLGLFLALTGVGVVGWGLVGEVFISDRQSDRSVVTLRVLQTPWNCRWGRLAYPLPHMKEEDQPESAWVCGYPGPRPSIAFEDCARCTVWEPIETASEGHPAHG